MKTRKIFAWLLSFALILSNIPVAFAASDGLSLSVEASALEIYDGETVDFTVYLNGADTVDGGIRGGSFWLDIPEGLSVVPGSFVSSGATGLTVSVNETSMGVAFAGNSGYTGEKGALASFSCVVDETAFGELAVGIAGNENTELCGETVDYSWINGDFSLVPAWITVMETWDPVWDLSLSVETEATEVSAGSVVDFTVYLNGADTVDGGIFGGSCWLDIPEGLSVVPGSFASSGATGLMVSVNETTMGIALAGTNGYTGEKGALATFSCTVDETAVGELMVGFISNENTELCGETVDYSWVNGDITLESAWIVVAESEDTEYDLRLSVETDVTEVSAGDTIDFTVYLNGANTVDGGIRGGSFWLDIPEGLSVISGSFVAGGTEGMNVSVDETTMGVAFVGNSGYTGEKGALATFSCTVDETAVGELMVGFISNENTELCGETVDYFWANGDITLESAWIVVAESEDTEYDLSLSVETDVTEVSAGDTVDFTVYLNGANSVDGGICGGSCWLNIPEGLSVVSGSFVSRSETGLMISVNETTMGIALAGTNGYTGEKGALATFSCTVDETAVGELMVGFISNENTELCGETVDYSWVNGDITLESAWIVVDDTDTISGECGDDLTWMLDNGVLTISGTGEMWRFGCQDSPWYDYREIITSVVIEDGVTSIGGEAFCGLSAMESITIPASVTYIGGYAFENCTALTSVTYNGSTVKWSLVRIGYGNEYLTGIEPTFTVVNDAEGTCGGNVIWELSGSVLTISGTGGMGGFGCQDSPWYAYREIITSVVIEDGVTSIGGEAFCGLSAMESITIPASVTYISSWAFENCTALTSVTYTGGPLRWAGMQIENGNECLTSANVTCTGVDVLEGSCGDNVTWAIADGVLTISGSGTMHYFNQGGAPWYAYRALFERAVIASGVTSIGRSAFYGCDNLTSVEIADSVTRIDWGAFMNCSALAEITIPAGVTNIGDYAFHYCTALTAIVIPDGVMQISHGAFSYCTNLASITIPASVTYIGSEAFYNCTALKNVTYNGSDEQWAAVEIEYGNGCLLNIMGAEGVCGDDLTWMFADGVLTISGTGAMYDFECCNTPWYSCCDAINSVIIEDGVTSIGSEAFCSGRFSSIEIPVSVTGIGDLAFCGCSEQFLVLYGGTEEQWSQIQIGNNNENLNNATILYNGTLYGEGTCGDNLTWVFDNGVLTISGTGEMWNFDCQNSPWYAYRELITSAVIADGVTSIGGEAFCGLSAMESITIPASVTYIGNWAFENCVALTDIVIPNGVMGIGNGTFNGCTALTSITIPASVTYIDSYAFENCTALKTVTFTGGPLHWAGVQIDEGNECLTSATVTCTGVDVTSGECGDAVVWNLSDDGVLTISGTGEMYDYDQFGAPWCAYGWLIEHVVIEDGVTNIGDSAFFECNNLTRVEIAESVTRIEWGAFQNCPALSSIEIPNGVTYIGNYAFQNCLALTDIVIPDGVTQIRYGVFSNCTALTSIVIPASVTYIDSYAYENCTALKTVTFTGGPLQWAGMWIEYGNECLTSATVTCTGVDVFEGTCGDNLTWVFNDGVLTISGEGEMWDFGCQNSPWYTYRSMITAVVITDGVTRIGSEAFCGLSAMESITIPASVTYIGSWAFENCTALTDIVIPDGVVQIRYGVFSNCTALTSIVIPASVNYISEEAFYNCTALTSVTFTGGPLAWTGVQIDEGNECLMNANVTCTGVDAFEGSCGDNLTWAIIDGVLTISGSGSMSGYKCKGSPWYVYRSLITSVVIEDGLINIGNEAFCGLSAMVSVTIPSSVTHIGSYAFEDCTALTDIVIPDGVTQIMNGTFYNCTALTSITLSGGVNRISSRAFYNCTALTTVYYNGLELMWEAIQIDDGNEALLGAEVVFADSSEEEVVASGICGEALTWKLTNHGVLTISGTGEMADYYGNNSAPWTAYAASIYVVVVEEGVTSIGEFAFYRCGDTLVSVTLPDSVTSIGGYAFERCGRLESIELPENLVSIGMRAFANCSNLRTISIPASVTEIGEQAFVSCNALESITVNDSNTAYADDNGVLLNKDMTNLICYPAGRSAQEYVVPATVKTISSEAFFDASLLAIVLPSGLEIIEWDAFAYCSGLKTIFIPASVTEIGSGALRGCWDLTAITVDKNNAAYTVVDGVLFTKDKKVLLTYPAGRAATEYAIPAGVTNMDHSAFEQSMNLTKVTIPGSLKVISSDAFWNCGSLTTVEIGNGVQTIGSSAFAYCQQLTVITIPGSVTSIENSAFVSCTNLAKVVFAGTSEQWAKLSVGSNNEWLKNAAVEFAGGSVLLGDVNGDGKVNGTDTNLIFRYVSGTNSFTAEQLLAADVNRDGVVNGTDTNLVFRFVSGTLGSLG